MMKRYRKAQSAGALLLAIAALIFLSVVPAAFADDPVDPLPPEEEPAFSNPAQAAHAENLAEASAAKAEAAAAAAVAAADKKETELQKAQDAFANLPGDATQEEIDAAQDAVDAAQDAFDQARENVEEKLAGIGGTSVEEITALRESGMGWGEIAHELGVHPGALGLGHTKAKSWKHGGEEELTGEIGEATQRNVKTGWAKGHAAKGNTGNGGGSGKDSAPGQNKDKSKGSSGKDKSDKGNSGKGKNK